MAHWLLLALVYLSFVSLGLPDAVLGVAWPAIRADMDQPLAAMGFITMTMTVCSASASFLSATITKRIGTGVVVAGSCLMTALALIGFSYVPSFVWLIVLGIPLGLGAGAVDASLNHFAAAHYSSRHMNWLHGFWGIGATAGPLIMGVALASSGGWAIGARSIGLLQMALAVVLWLSLSLWSKENATPPTTEGTHGKPVQFKPVRTAALWLAPLTFLFYVAAEMGTGLWAASILVGSRGVALTMAGVWVSLYFGAITVGRFGVGLVANQLGNRKLVRLGICTASVGAALFAVPQLPAPFSMAGLMLMGLGCAPVFPSLMHETARRFPDEVARKVIGRQMSLAYAGGAIIPAAFGLLATWAGLGAVMPIVVVMLLALLVATIMLDSMT
jgi:fucose permease